MPDADDGSTRPGRSISQDDGGDTPPDDTEREQPLTGGMANVGKVVRVGDTVRRPATPYTEAGHALLQHLERVGFDGAPRLLGVDQKGRSILTYVEGDVGVPPYPGWVASAELLVSVAELQRRFHDAVATFVPPTGAVWNTTLATAAGAVVGHNDLCVENVVAREGRAVAFIDFDFAAPVDPLWDVAIALRHWVPVRDPLDLDDARADVDQVARFHAYCDVYGVAQADRARVVAHGLAFLDQAYTSMKARADAGQPGYVEAWKAGYAAQNRRSHAWLAANADVLAGA